MNGRHYNASPLEIRNLIQVLTSRGRWMFVRSCKRFRKDRRSGIAKVLVQHVHHGDPQTCFEKPVPCISRDASGRHRSRTGEPYTKSQLLAYWTICDELIDGAVDALDLAAPECGFFWYKVSKIEHQMINLR